MQGKPIRNPQSQSGLSFIQMLMVTAIMALLGQQAGAYWQQSVEWRRLDGHTHEMLQTLHWGRSLAVSTRQNIRLAIQTTAQGQQCVLVHSGSIGDCQCQSSGSALCNNTAQAYKVNLLDSSQGVSLHLNSSLMWEPSQGRAAPAGTLQIGHRNGSQVNLVVSMMGRVRACVPDGKARQGYAKC